MTGRSSASGFGPSGRDRLRGPSASRDGARAARAHTERARSLHALETGMARHLTAREAAALLRPQDRLAVPLGPGQPAELLHALGERDDWVELQVFGALLLDLYPLFTRPGVRYLSGFYGPAERILLAQGGRVEFVPSDFRRFSPLVQRFAPRVIAAATTPPDADGWMSLSLYAGAGMDELARAMADPDRLVIAEASPKFPRTVGIRPDYPHRVHVDQADVIVESDRAPVALPDVEPTDVDLAIAGHVRDLVPDGATLQSGIGGVPSMVMELLAEGPGGDYGVHSEMFTTGLMRLHLAGKVTNRRKGQFDGMSVTTFALGNAELYEWLDGNTDVRFLPVEAVNSPEVIAKNRAMVSVNGALMVDLYGQVAADTRAGEQYSGIGGHEDFVASSGFELEDRSMVCLPSTARAGDGPISRIVPALPPGWLVTTPRHQLDLVVTEYGVAHLRGHTVHERALALAGIAAPEHRDALYEAAACLT